LLFLSIGYKTVVWIQRLFQKINEVRKEGLSMRENKGKNTELAGRIYDTSDYQKNDELSNGLAMTHEQASDSYVEGQIGGKIERSSGAEEELNNRGYQ
jgi:hypothetical protein